MNMRIEHWSHQPNSLGTKMQSYIEFYRNMGRTVLPLPHPTSKTLEFSLQETNSGNSFNK